MTQAAASGDVHPSNGDDSQRLHPGVFYTTAVS